MILFAHVGHWAIQLLYVLPVLFVVGAIVWSKVQERREEAAEAEIAGEAEGPEAERRPSDRV